ncbi:MAG: hypothetical protein ACRD2C_08715 [Acidimicrobiales bacterium]
MPHVSSLLTRRLSHGSLTSLLRITRPGSLIVADNLVRVGALVDEAKPRSERREGTR